MAQQARLVEAMTLCDSASTAAATRTRQRAFDGEDELARLRQLSLKDTDIRDVERYRDQRVLGHHKPSLRSRADDRAIVNHFSPRRNSYI